MLKRFAVVASVAAAAVIAACVDMSAPKGAASISLLQLPALYIVLGDSMRDTNGVAKQPSVVAYDASGSPIEGSNAQFFITDSLPVAKFGANGVLTGTALGTVHVIGQIGNLQTPAIAVPVTVAPNTMFTLATDTTLAVPITTDSATSIGSVGLAVFVHGGAKGDTAVQGVIVTYTMAPHPTIAKFPSAYLADDAGAMSIIDTTDASGQASRKLVVNSLALDRAVVGGKPDSVLVTATAKYKGALIPGAPITFKISLKPSFSLP